MTTLVRRQFLQGLNAALATSIIPSSITSAASSMEATTRPISTFTEGCIFVRHSSQRAIHHCALDLWTARASDIDLASLPAHLNTVVVYDDLFLDRNLSRKLVDTARSIPDLFDLDPTDCSFGFHLDGLSQMSDVLSEFTGGLVANNSACIGIIDIASCGVTRLDWPDILPTIRGQYDLVVGFHASPGRTMGDWYRFCEEAPRPDSQLIRALKHCDLTFLTSDDLLGLDEVTKSEGRTPAVTDLLREILQSLSSPPILKQIQHIREASTFCVGPVKTTSEDQKAFEVARQQAVIAGGFSDGVIHQRYNKEAALVLDKLALWPLKAQL